MMSNRKGCQTQSLIDHWQCPREASTSITNILCVHYYLVDDRVGANFTFQLLRYFEKVSQTGYRKIFTLTAQKHVNALKCIRIVDFEMSNRNKAYRLVYFKAFY